MLVSQRFIMGHIIGHALGVFPINRIVVSLNIEILKPLGNFTKSETFFIPKNPDCISIISQWATIRLLLGLLQEQLRWPRFSCMRDG